MLDSTHIISQTLVVPASPQNGMERHQLFPADIWSQPPGPWIPPQYRLISHQTKDPFFLAHPSDSLLAKRHAWNRSTQYGKVVDYTWNGSQANQHAWRWHEQLNSRWMMKRPWMKSVEWDEFREIDWNPVEKEHVAPVSPRTIPSDRRAKGELQAMQDFEPETFSMLAARKDSKNGSICSPQASNNSDLDDPSFSNSAGGAEGHDYEQSKSITPTSSVISTNSTDSFATFISYIDAERVRIAEQRRQDEARSAISGDDKFHRALNQEPRVQTPPRAYSLGHLKRALVHQKDYEDEEFASQIETAQAVTIVRAGLPRLITFQQDVAFGYPYKSSTELDTLHGGQHSSETAIVGRDKLTLRSRMKRWGCYLKC